MVTHVRKLVKVARLGVARRRAAQFTAGVRERHQQEPAAVAPTPEPAPPARTEREFEYDPTPWDEMTNEEKKAHSAKLREQMRETQPDPDDDSLEILTTFLVDTDKPQ